MTTQARSAATPYVAVSGPTGAGKTTLARALGERLRLRLVAEPVDPGLLAAFAAEPRRWAFALERSIVTARAAALKRATPPGTARPVLLDRSLEEDRAVFFELLRSLGVLNPELHARLRRVAADLEAEIGPPAAVVCLWAPVEVLAERTARAGHPTIYRESLPLQHELYGRWRHGLDLPVLDLDTGGDRASSPERVQERAVEWIEAQFLVEA